MILSFSNWSSLPACSFTKDFLSSLTYWSSFERLAKVLPAFSSIWKKRSAEWVSNSTPDVASLTMRVIISVNPCKNVNYQPSVTLKFWIFTSGVGFNVISSCFSITLYRSWLAWNAAVRRSHEWPVLACRKIKLWNTIINNFMTANGTWSDGRIDGGELAEHAHFVILFSERYARLVTGQTMWEILTI